MSATSWQIGEKARCEWQGDWYPVKIMKVEASREEEPYYVHFSGWNSRYDAWVSADRLKAEARSAKEEERRKRVREEEEEEEEGEPSRKRVKVPLPRELKEQLVADWERITVEPRQWVPVPRSPCVREIVGEFVESRGRDGRWREFGDAVVAYFDKALPKILLYRYEREQWDILKRRHDDSTPSKLFGAEHLVRLFAKLPELLVHTNLSNAEISHTKTKLSDLFKFLVKRRDRYFLAHYELREKLLDDRALDDLHNDDLSS